MREGHSSCFVCLGAFALPSFLHEKSWGQGRQAGTPRISISALCPRPAPCSSSCSARILLLGSSSPSFSKHLPIFLSSFKKMEGGNKFKKRGRGAEEESFPGTPTAKKQVTCHNDTNSIDELSCSQTQELELHNLKVFDFPWLHEEEGMMGESEELFSLEDSFFSSTLNHPTNYCTIAGVPFELSGESETPSVAFPPPQDKWPLEACDDTEGRQIDGSDCIWAPLLNKPLQSTLNYT